MGTEDAQRIAHELGEFAVKVANDERCSSPFPATVTQPVTIALK